MVDVLRLHCIVKGGIIMYIVEAKNEFFTCEREFTRKAWAIKAAAKTANDGFVTLDNPEMNPVDRKVIIRSVRVYSSDSPDIDIDF